MHHLVVDAFSFRWLLEDFFLATTAIARHDAPRFESKTASYKSWCEARGRDAQSDELDGERAFWVEQRRGPTATVATTTRDDVRGRSRNVGFLLDADETTALLGVSRPPFGADPQEVLLAAIGMAFAPSARGALLVDIEGHGRDGDEAIDVSRTVGWFTAVYPVRLDGTRASGGFAAMLRSIKESTRSVPRGGIGAGGGGPQASIGVNYLGQLDRAFADTNARVRLAIESAGPEQSPLARRPHALEVQAFVLDGRFRVTLVGAPEAPLDRWAADIERELRAFLGAAIAPDTHAYTPADFPDAVLTTDELDGVLAEVLGSGASP